MLAELRQKSQITIPKEITVKLGLVEGDKFEIIEKDGTIMLIPVAIYPKRYIDDLHAEIENVKSKLAAGEQPVFDNIDDLFASLEED